MKNRLIGIYNPTIILTYIGGQQKHILQKGAYYLSENHLPFYPIDEDLGSLLTELLQGIK